MRRKMFLSKIHRATVTEANLNYEGSITIDAALLEASGILPWEMVDIWNITNGERFQTYVIAGKPNSGVVCLNGAAARKVSVGDKVIIAASAEVEDEEARNWHPTVVKVDEKNRVVEVSKKENPFTLYAA